MNVTCLNEIKNVHVSIDNTVVILDRTKEVDIDLELNRENDRIKWIQEYEIEYFGNKNEEDNDRGNRDKTNKA